MKSYELLDEIISIQQEVLNVSGKTAVVKLDVLSRHLPDEELVANLRDNVGLVYEHLATLWCDVLEFCCERHVSDQRPTETETAKEGGE